MSFAPLPATACWEHRAARSGFEVAYFQAAPGGWRMDGTTAAVEDGQTWIVSYSIRLDAAWITREARVTARTASGRHETLLACDGEGRWHVDGRAAAHLDGCLDVDLESSALTNTLPVHRLGLATGAQATTPAAYVRALDLRAERLEQSYARLPDELGPGLPGYRRTRRLIRLRTPFEPACPFWLMLPCLRAWRGRGRMPVSGRNNKAPSMYEMEGALPGHVALGSPVAR